MNSIVNLALSRPLTILAAPYLKKKRQTTFLAFFTKFHERSLTKMLPSFWIRQTQTDRQTDSQRVKQTVRQSDSQTDRQRKRTTTKPTSMISNIVFTNLSKTKEENLFVAKVLQSGKRWLVTIPLLPVLISLREKNQYSGCSLKWDQSRENTSLSIASRPWGK